MQKHFVIILVTFLVWGCADKKQVGPTQGLVRYQIDYPEEIKSNPMFSLLPVEMDMIFDSTAVKLKVKGDLNLFSLEFLSRAKGDSCYTIFRMPTRKMVYQLGKDEKWFLFDSGAQPEMRMRPDSVKQIAGFDCHLVELLQKTGDQPTSSAFFTDQLAIDPKMFRTPFHKVPGVPLEFEIDLNGLKFKFKAKEFKPFPTDERMILPSEYDLTTRQEMRSTLDYFLN